MCCTSQGPLWICGSQRPLLLSRPDMRGEDDKLFYVNILACMAWCEAVDIVFAAEHALQLFDSYQHAALLTAPELLPYIFAWTSSSGSKSVGASWLALLTRHSVDIHAYLECLRLQPHILDFSRYQSMPLTSPYADGLCRSSILESGLYPQPTLGWSWKWDPEESALNMLQEFENLVYCDDWWWPFYRSPSHSGDRIPRRFRREERKEARSARRSAVEMKMPGAFPVA